MFDKHKIDEMSAKLFSILPEQIRQAEATLKQGFKDILTQALSQLDVVTREEFDVQTKVLARTREKVEALQGKVEVLGKRKKK